MSDLASAVRVPFAVASSIRHARVFHPHGVSARGHAELTAPWWPIRGDVPVTARLSRGIGLPRALPDLFGLALKFDPDGSPWDVLLVTAVPGVRVAPIPASDWTRGHYSSVTAFRTPSESQPRWVLAEPGDPEHTGHIRFDLAVAPLVGASTPAGRVVLEPESGVDDDHQPTFDPVLNSPDGVEMWPRWVGALRRSAYRGSRAGRASGH